MKKLLIVLFFVSYATVFYAQWNPTGDNSSTGNLTIKGNINVSGNKLLTAHPTHNFTYDDQTMGEYSFRWGYDSWRPIENGHTFWLSSHVGIKFFTASRLRFAINHLGNVGIGTANPTSLLDVNGTIRSKEVKIEATGWSDFVFAEDYKLPSLSTVETHIKEHKHLPNIPSEAEVMENGISVGEMQAKLLQKIEELTLYVIELKKENEEIKKQLLK